VSKQRAHQIAEEPGFPAPVAQDARARLWSRWEVQGWAKRWRTEKPGASEELEPSGLGSAGVHERGANA
jgi:hypothetical protein